MREITKDTKNWICTVNLENSQKNYADCLRLILWLEDISLLGVSEVRYEGEFVPFRISYEQFTGFGNASAFKRLENVFQSEADKKFSSITSEEMFLFGLRDISQSHSFCYYLRVHMEDGENDLADLQYLLLMIQSVSNVHNRIAVRLMNAANSEWGTQDYFRVSHYLQFVQQRYQCFYACYDSSIDTLQKLQVNGAFAQQTFLPLLEIDAGVCQILNRTWTVEVEYSGQEYKKLYQAIKLRHEDERSIVYRLFQIGIRFLFTQMSGRKYTKKKSKIELLNMVERLINEIHGITALDITLMGALGCGIVGGKLDYNKLQTDFGRIQTLSRSISQLLENIVNHSQRNRGVFTFRLQQNDSYLKRHYPGFAGGNTWPCLELLIADSNRKDSIVSHFMASNKADYTLKEYGGDVRLSCLFGSYNNAEEEQIWHAARGKNPAMCHGLLSFAEGVNELGGAYLVRSSPVFTDKDSKGIYYCCGGENRDYKTVESSYIPGTQFSVVLSRPLESKGRTLKSDDEWAFDFDRLVYATNYKELALALDFDKAVQILDTAEFLRMAEETVVLNQETKDFLALKCRDWINAEIASISAGIGNKIIYYCDLEPLCLCLSEHPEIGEPFCKGFLSSRFFVNIDCNVYYAILLQNPDPRFSQIFWGNLQAVALQGSFITDNTCVCFYPKRSRNNSLPYYASTMHEQIGRELNINIFPRVFPYSLFIKNKYGQTLFEDEMLVQATRSITDQEKQGFMIPDTHMRLGNKVHLDTFYEMALFFENPNYAYYTAFAFLQRFISENPGILCQNKKLLFYGYASYSRSIVWAILRILNEYRIMTKACQFPEMAFVIYQNDLKAESDEPQAQMYYSRAEWQRNPKNIWSVKDTELIMVVPISSSLTTFNKMKAELNRETGQIFQETENFTALWVRNQYKDECSNTKEEAEFWDSSDPAFKTIKTPLTDKEIHYMVAVTSKWSNPLECKKCFPEDSLFEFPLVETDATSTVPTQQLYLERNVTSERIFSEDETDENDRRVARLKNNMAYGHIVKGSNHFQYFVRTRVYFQQERDEIEKWLGKLRTQTIEQSSKEFFSPGCINILVIPQQTNNVEFGQYVYEYYFKGCAESIVINTEKEFRSNLNAEYSGLFRQLANIENPEKNIRFYYADMSISSGNGFHRVVSLLTACMQVVTKNAEYNFRFEKIFLLVNRLSVDSKRTYVSNPEKNFHAYVNLNISYMRTFGDSCVPCKLQQEAKSYHSKAATKSVSSYWEKKEYDRQCCSFDQLESLEQITQEEGYRRMICSHRAAHFLNPVRGGDLPDYFRAVKDFLDEMQYADTDERSCGIYVEMDNSNRREWYSAAFKVLVRPFLSYDYRMRCVAMDLFLVLAEHLLGNADIEQLRKRLSRQEAGERQSKKAYLLECGNLEWIIRLAENIKKAVGSDKWELLIFIRNNILKGLTDIKSNYLLRKSSIIQLSERLGEVLSDRDEKEKFVADFYEHYLRSVLRITHSSSDETKSVWLEYLLQYGEEYNSDLMERSALERRGLESFVGCVPESVKKEFKDFLEILLIENNRPLYQAIMEVRKQSEEENTGDFDGAKVQDFLDNEYHMRNARIFLSMSDDRKIYQEQLLQLSELSKYLDRASHSIDGYENLRNMIQKIVAQEENSFDLMNEVVLFGKDAEQARKSEYLELPEYFIIAPNEMQGIKESVGSDVPWKKINWVAGIGRMLKHGFFLQEMDAGTFDIVLLLDNNYEELRETSDSAFLGQKIEPIYIYVPCKLDYHKALGLTRKLLIFRNRMIRWLEMDFNNNAIAQLSRQKYISRLLSTDKIGDHNEMDFIACEQQLLMTVTKEEYESESDCLCAASRSGEEEELYEDFLISNSPPISDVLTEEREWFFLRAYVNSRIARMFRTIAREEEWGQSQEADEMQYFGAENTSIMVGLARNMKTVFFTPVNDGLNRKNYLRQMLNCITISVEGENDYGSDLNADIETRLNNLKKLFERFDFMFVGSGQTVYGYKAEYLVVILLDCFVSAVKAGNVWNQSEWGGLAFKELMGLPAYQKCKVCMKRENGGIAFNRYAYDYLVLSNEVFPNKEKKKGLGMSQKSIRWYIEKFWKSLSVAEKESDNLPKVLMPEESVNMAEYYIKLPILLRKEGAE